MEPSGKGKPPGAATPGTVAGRQSERERRLAEALRANLKRRKSASRSGAPDAETPGDSDD